LISLLKYTDFYLINQYICSFCLSLIYSLIEIVLLRLVVSCLSWIITPISSFTQGISIASYTVSFKILLVFISILPLKALYAASISSIDNPNSFASTWKKAL